MLRKLREEQAGITTGSDRAKVRTGQAGGSELSDVSLSFKTYGDLIAALN